MVSWTCGIYRNSLSLVVCRERANCYYSVVRGRFQNIMHHLRFDDRDTRSERVQTDRFAAISNIWGLFVTNCITSYIPGQHITIDEQLFPCKTRCCFLQYIATKPDKFGIKFWVACDLKTKYVCNILPYLGKDPTRPRGERVSESVVMRLMTQVTAVSC